MSSAFMIAFNKVTKQQGTRVLYRQISFQINPMDRMGLVGPNGAGKTTLFRLIVGEESADEGTITKPDQITIGYFSQNIEEMRGRSALEEVQTANPRLEAIQKSMKECEQKLTEPMDDDEMTRVLEKYGQLQSDFERLGGYQMESRAAEILTGLGIGPSDYHRPTESFSGGWKMRIALAKILAINPRLLLLDEPTNHLDMESITWLESWIASYKGALFMTSHDRDFMNRLVNQIVEVGRETITVYSGNYDFYEKERTLRHEQLVAAAKRQEEMLAKEEEFIARFAARASHAAQVQSRVKKLEKIERIEVPTEEKAIAFEWPVPPRGGDEVVKFENLGKTWLRDDGEERLVFRGAKALVRRLDRVAVVGVNGAGKSTLLKILTGQTEPTEGSYQIGSSIEVGYFSQNSLDVLDPKKTVLEEVVDRVPNSTIGYVRNLLGAFKFSGDEVEKKVSVLSGGEKSRLVLATILAKPVNFLVLDEPTNHLDIASREVLLEALKNFPGTVMMVSHDRYFLRQLTSRVFELDRHELTVYDGTWEEYLRFKESRAGAPASV